MPAVRHRSLPAIEEDAVTNSVEAEDILFELLRLYELRFEIAKREKALETDTPPLAPVDREIERLSIERDLRKYGREKKAGWERARAHFVAEGK
jgi:hypothetical protein